MQSYVMHKPANDPIFTFIGQCCVDIVNMDEEVLELPAFWSVGCLTRKSESFRLRYVLFTAVHSADFPLFPSRLARSNSILGQKWVKFSRLH